MAADAATLKANFLFSPMVLPFVFTCPSSGAVEFGELHRAY